MLMCSEGAITETLHPCVSEGVAEKRVIWSDQVNSHAPDASQNTDSDDSGEDVELVPYNVIHFTHSSVPSVRQVTATFATLSFA